MSELIAYVFPVQAKGGRDRLSAIQVMQDMAMCRHKFPDLICRCIGAQFTAEDTIVLFEFFDDNGAVGAGPERHYRLVGETELTTQDLENYKRLAED